MNSKRRFSDLLRFFSVLSLPKLANAALVLSSFYLSKWLRKPIQWGMPFNVSIEPTTTCNLRCPECPSGLRAFTRNTGNMSPETFDSILNQFSENLIWLYFYFQGEPFINPHFLHFVKKAKERKMYTVTSTNAHYITEETANKIIDSGLDRIIISIDGLDQKTYEQYRVGGNLDKVIKGVKTLVAAKKKRNAKAPYILFQMLVVKPNEHQISDLYSLAKELDVDDVLLKTAQVYDYKNGNSLIPENEKYSRYIKQLDGTYKIKNKLLNHCWKLWHSCVLTWDAYLVPCCFDKDAQYKMGNIIDTPFLKIWQSDLYKSFRTRILKERAQIDICSNCTEGTKVWIEH